MTCRLCKEKILEYLYDELNEDDRRLMDRHLETSASCREHYRIFQSVRNIAAEESDPDFPQALHTRIMAHATEAKTPPWWRAAWAPRFRPALATTLVAVAAVGIYFHASRIQGPSPKKYAVMIKDSPDASLNEVRMARSVKDKKTSPLKGREATGTIDSPVPGSTMKTDMSGSPEKEALPALQPEPAEKKEGSGAGEERFREIPEEAVPVYAKRKASAAPDMEAADTLGKAGFSSPTRSRPEAVPPPLTTAVDLARAGRCREARPKIEAFLATHPQDAACGLACLELARCFLAKGEKKIAREMARKAGLNPQYSHDAEIFLDSFQLTD